MKIVDIKRFIACLSVLLIFIGLYFAIGTIERRQEIPEEIRQVVNRVEDKPDSKVMLSGNQKESTLHLRNAKCL